MQKEGQSYTGNFMPIGNLKFAIGGAPVTTGAGVEVTNAFEGITSKLNALKPTPGHEAQWHDGLSNLKAAYFALYGSVTGVGVI